MRRALAAFLVSSCVVSCSDGSPGQGSSSVSAPASVAPTTAPPSKEASERIAVLRDLEHRRAAVTIDEVDLASRDVHVRRAAARALARVGGAQAHPKLLRMLFDEDAEVTMWSAYGLGFHCKETREASVDALVARVLSLPQEDGHDDAFAAIARAVGACASPTRTESTLAAWLGTKPARARAASLALGDFAGQTKRLREETWVSLFARAAGGVNEPAQSDAFFAVSRVDNVPPSVVDRLTEVASARLSDAGPFRLYTIRALGRAKAGALAPLERVLLADGATFTMQERVEAARIAARFGVDGQTLLGKLVGKLAATPPGANDDTAVLLAALAVLTDANAASKSLAALSAAAAPKPDDARSRRITSLVRCAAARVPRDVKADAPALVACDLDNGSILRRTLAEVVGRSEITGKNLATFKTLLADSDTRVREAALELLPMHAEIPDRHKILADALAAKEPGVVNVAAEQIKASPSMCTALPPAPKKKKPKDKDKDKDKPKKPEPEDGPPPAPAKEIETALLAALERADKEHDLELLGAVIAAVGALGQTSLLPKIQPYCASIHPTAREQATNAIALLSQGRRPTCAAPDRADEVAPEVAAPLAERTTVVFDTDAGELSIELDPEIAPVAAARFVSLVKRGYYDGTALHRVDPSFVVQFGSQTADSFGGPTDLPPVRCETAPLPFEAMTAGVALSGRDTGSSQFFVMRGRFPHLDGKHAVIGKAKGPWDAAFEGDAIKKATVSAR